MKEAMKEQYPERLL